MGRTVKSKILKWWISARYWLIAIGGALLGLLIWGQSRERTGKKIGAAKQRAKESRERAANALAKGDDQAVLDEWRRSRKT